MLEDIIEDMDNLHLFFIDRRLIHNRPHSLTSTLTYNLQKSDYAHPLIANRIFEPIHCQWTADGCRPVYGTCHGT
ncbi:MAG: hypothetical protein ACI96P_000466 [Candidatus Azotimanducaceae bacterium]|jgi:hypothetical protein